MYNSDESQETIIEKGKKQVEEFLTTEQKIKEQMAKLEEQYVNVKCVKK